MVARDDGRDMHALRASQTRQDKRRIDEYRLNRRINRCWVTAGISKMNELRTRATIERCHQFQDRLATLTTPGSDMFVSLAERSPAGGCQTSAFPRD